MISSITVAWSRVDAYLAAGPGQVQRCTCHVCLIQQHFRTTDWNLHIFYAVLTYWFMLEGWLGCKLFITKFNYYVHFFFSEFLNLQVSNECIRFYVRLATFIVSCIFGGQSSVEPECWLDLPLRTMSGLLNVLAYPCNWTTMHSLYIYTLPYYVGLLGFVIFFW